MAWIPLRTLLSKRPCPSHRQLTREEADTLTIDPSAVRPPDIDDTMLFGEEHALPPVERVGACRRLLAWQACRCLLDKH